MRRVPSIDQLIPALYLKGISTGDFTEALSAILGEKAAGLSATNIVRLKAGWEEEYKAWCQRDLSTKAYVYWWADGIYFNVRLDEERSCVLVLIGALEDGSKELLAVVDGYRESTQSWPVAKAETADTFTRHGLPIPGAYFKSKESQKPATVAVSKSATTWPRYEPLLGTAFSMGRSSALRSANNMTNTERNRRKRHRLRGEAIVA